MIGLALAAALAPRAAAFPVIHDSELVSETQSGAPATGRSQYGELSEDGRFLLFQSTEEDLAPNDTNGRDDVFLYDHSNGSLVKLSVGWDGSVPDERSGGASMSSDARWILFTSQATNIVPADTNGFQDTYLLDRSTGQIEVISVGFLGDQGNNHSFGGQVTNDGRYVAFTSWATNLTIDDPNQEVADVFVRDRQTGTTERIPGGQAGLPSLQTNFDVSITQDGRYVAFVTSYAPVPGDPTQVQHFNAYVYDRQTAMAERVSTNSDGEDNVAWPGTLGCFSVQLSDDGRYAVFQCNGSNLVPYDDGSGGLDDVFIKDRQTGLTERVSVTDWGGDLSSAGYRGRFSEDGRYVAFLSTATEYGAPGGPNPKPMGIWVHDRLAGQTDPILIQQMSPPSGVGFSTSDVFITSEARHATHGFPLNSSAGGPSKDIFRQERGDQLGILDLSVTCGQPDVTVTVEAALAPEVVTEVDRGLGLPSGRALGAEITALRMVLRPERDDVMVHLGVRSLMDAKVFDTLPPGNPDAILYRISFDAGGQSYAVLVSRATGTTDPPEITLQDCTGGGCVEIAALQGGFGTVGEVIRTVIPLGLLPSGPVAVTNVLAASSRDDGGIETQLDSMEAPDGTLSGRLVEVGAADPGVPVDQVTFVPASPSGCGFTATLTGVPEGSRIWARACVGAECSDRFVDCPGATAGPVTGADRGQLVLAQNAPNPFRSRSVIQLALPRAGPVKLSIFDVSGRRVRTLLDGPEEAGALTVVWDGRDDAGRAVAGGVYFYVLDAAAGTVSRKMLRLR